MNRRITRQSILTPLGRGAVATLAVYGPRALEIVGDCLAVQATAESMWRLADRVLLRGLKGVAGTEEVVLVVSSPERVEIHCHGGAAAVEGIALALERAGAARASWPDAMCEASHDDCQAEAHAALASATTERTAAILLDQYRGALSRELSAIQSLIDECRLADADSRLSRLEQLTPLGMHLIVPWSVVLTGRPNVGKSSLINALLGYERSIVFDEPGTTRDVLTAAAAIDGWPVVLTDTAGLHAASDRLEAIGVARAREQAARADCVLLVVDASDPPDMHALPESLAGLPPQTPRIVVGNKCDTIPPTARGRWQQRWPSEILTSTTTGEAIAALAERIGRELAPHAPVPGEAVPFLPRHVERIALLRQRIISMTPDAGGLEAPSQPAD